MWPSGAKALTAALASPTASGPAAADDVARVGGSAAQDGRPQVEPYVERPMAEVGPEHD